MFVKLSVLPASEAPPCPFYARTVKGGHVCFVKQAVPVHVAMALVEDNPEFNPESWDEDCGGDPEKCSIVGLLYQLDEAEDDVVEDEAPQYAMLGGSAGDFDPLGVDEEDEPESDENDEEDEPVVPDAVEEAPLPTPPPAPVKRHTASVPVKKQGRPAVAAKNKVIVSEPEPIESDVNVSIHQVSDPYTVLVDILVYPTNNALVIDDSLLIRHGAQQLQKECERYQLGAIRMGHVYPTSNGGDHPGGVKARRLYHAVVGGSSRLVDPACIQKAVKNALRLAEMEQAETIAMLPCDCGTWDIQEVAQAQLLAIYNYLKSEKPTSLKNVVILIEDDETLEVFNRYFDKVWGG